MDIEENKTPESVEASETPAAETPITPAETPAAPAPTPAPAPAPEPARPSKFCSHCGGKIDAQAVICPLCGCQVEQVAPATPNVVINNTNTNTQQQTVAPVVMGGTPKNKWVALLLCFFLGGLGIHKFYEGKIAMGIIYILTVGLCGVGILVDLITLLFKPNPYYV